MITKIDRTKLSSGSFLESVKERRRYWQNKSPEERLEALEFLRMQVYEDPYFPPRLKRVLEIAHRS